VRSNQIPFRSAFDYALDVVERLLGQLGDFPNTTEGGRWLLSAHGGWTAGFWVGLLWLGHLERREERLRAEAGRWLGKLA